MTARSVPEFQHLLVSREDATAVVTLNRPDRRNALSLAMMLELIACLNEIGRDPGVRAVILAAAGKAFCSGHDLTELRERTEGEYREIFDVCCRLMDRLQTIPQPVIAEVQGIATAAGCQLVAASDLAIASESASFATPGVRIGIFCSTPMVALTRAIGRKRAFEMLVTGSAVDARTAAEWGLINRSVPDSELSLETRRLAEQIGAASSLVMGLGKAAFYAQIDLEQANAYAYVKDVMTKNALAADAREGIAAFLEKRSPSWSGK